MGWGKLDACLSMRLSVCVIFRLRTLSDLHPLCALFPLFLFLCDVGLWTSDSAMPLSFAQTHHLAFHGCFDNEILLARCNSDLDLEALSVAFQGLIDRHPALRSSFHVNSTEQELAGFSLDASQLPTKAATSSHLMVTHLVGSVGARANFEVIDCSKHHSTPADLEAFILQEAHREFDLTQAPLCRARVFVNTGDRIILLVAVDPIVCDKWSITNLIDDLKST
jgi:hypothetical protein